jgi:hypothetical protein
MAVGRRRFLVQQAGFVWADRGAEALQRFVDTGSLGDEDERGDALPYDQDLVKQIVESGRLV